VLKLHFLWPPCVADADIIFLSCFFFLLSSFFPRLMHVEKVASLDNLLRRSDEYCCQVYWSVAGYSVRRRDWADMAGWCGVCRKWENTGKLFTSWLGCEQLWTQWRCLHIVQLNQRGQQDSAVDDSSANKPAVIFMLSIATRTLFCLTFSLVLAHTNLNWQPYCY